MDNSHILDVVNTGTMSVKVLSHPDHLNVDQVQLPYLNPSTLECRHKTITANYSSTLTLWNQIGTEPRSLLLWSAVPEEPRRRHSCGGTFE